MKLEPAPKDKIIKYLADNYGRPFTNDTNQEIANLINGLNREERGELRYRLFNEARRLEMDL